MWCGCLEFAFLVVATASSASIAILGFILRKALGGKCVLFSTVGAKTLADTGKAIYIQKVFWMDSTLCGLVLVIGVGGSLLCLLNFISLMGTLSKRKKSWKISTLSVFFETLFLLLTGIGIVIVYFGVKRFSVTFSGPNGTVYASNQTVVSVNDQLVNVKYMYNVMYSVQVCFWVFLLSVLGEMCCSIYRLLVSAGQFSYQQTVAVDGDRAISNLYEYSPLSSS